MGFLLAYLFLRGPVLFRVLAWAVVAAIVLTAILLPFLNPNDMPKGPVPSHGNHSHVHPASYLRR